MGRSVMWRTSISFNKFIYLPSSSNVRATLGKIDYIILMIAWESEHAEIGFT